MLNKQEAPHPGLMGLLVAVLIPLIISYFRRLHRPRQQ